MAKVLRSRLLIMVLMLVLVATFFTGCGGSEGTTDTSDSSKSEKSNETKSSGTTSDKKSSEGVTVTWATIAGFYSDWIDGVAKEFEKETGIKVEQIQIDNAIMYEKQGIEMASHTGVYDLVTCETMWKAEWANAGYIEPIDDLVAKYDMAEDLKNFDPGTLKLAGQWNGKTYALPYYTYNQGMFARQDLFEDPTEKAAFKAEYGEELRIPDTYEYFKKVADFFTREAGEKLKGEVLEQPFYGVGLMAGRFPEIQDEYMGMLWANGGDVMDENYQPTVNSDIGVSTMEYYTYLVDNCAPPGARTSSYDEVVAQLKEGLIAMTGPFFLDQWPNAVQTEDNIPGAKVIATTSPQGKGYIGAFGIAISKDSKHKDEAFQFLKYLMSFETQKQFALGGGSTIRRDVLTDPEVIAPENRKTTGQFPALVEMMDLQKDVKYTVFDTPAAGKIYEEMMIHCNMAANHEKSAKEAMDMLAKRITELNKPFESVLESMK
jgi:multiple sugar transport system substrate-binding protein